METTTQATPEATQAATNAEPKKKLIVTKEMLAEKLTITRNDVTWDFIPGKLKKGKNSKEPDQFALVPVEPKSKEDKERFHTWVSDPATDILVGKVRAMSNLWTRNAVRDQTEAEGKDFISLFTDYASKFSSRGETFKSLFEEKGKLEMDLREVAADLNLPQDQKLARLTEIAMKLSEINDSIEYKKSKSAEDDEEEKATEE